MRLRDLSFSSYSSAEADIAKVAILVSEQRLIFAEQPLVRLLVGRAD